MNVLIIAPQPFYTDRGTPMNVRMMCQVLCEEGYQVDLATFPGGRDVRLDNLRIFRVPNYFRATHIPVGPSRIKICFDIILSVYAFILCVRRRHQIIHGIEEACLISTVLGKLFNIPSICDMDSYLPQQLANSQFLKGTFWVGLSKLLISWAARNSSLVITVCSALSQKAHQMAPGVRIVQIEDIPVPTDNTFLSNTERTDLLERYGINECKRIIYTGNLEPYQGIDLLIEAWEWIHKNKMINSRCKLIIVGGEQDKVEYYQDIACQKGLEESIVLTGRRPLAEMGFWMSVGHAFVSPRSQGENTPLKIYSYMAAGSPIVVTDMTTHTQALSSDEAFLAFPDAQSFGTAIVQAVEDRHAARIKATAAKIKVEREYTYHSFKRKLLQAYNYLLD